MAKPGTEIYLEAFQAPKASKTKIKFVPRPKPEEQGPTKFIPNSGPEDAQNFPDKNKANLESSPELSQGTQTTKHDGSAIISGTDINTHSAVNPEKAVGIKINNSRRKKLMEKVTTNNKSEFDRLCEEVLGPDEVELGIEAPAADGGEGADEACAECGTPAERIRNLITELEGILAELEGTAPGDDAAPVADEGGEVPLEEEGAMHPGAVREAVESEEVGTPLGSMKKGNPDAVTGRANVVDGDGSKVSKGKADAKINKPGTGELETAPDGKEMNGKPSRANQVVKSKLSTNQVKPMFNV